MKKFMAAMLGSVVAVTALMGTAAPANAAAAGTQVAAACAKIFDVGVTYQSGYSINGEGSYTECSTEQQSIKVHLQKYVGLGYWSTLQTMERTSSGIQWVSYYCRDTGTQTYRVKVELWGQGGYPPPPSTIVGTKYSNEIRVSC
ncbi:hypothetical protein ABT297_42970 [Dactylosporangium sp. NPDC000555]|uniref:hypothetical protein n=1 Tax=Dactylosporangium sp. NPDC000555 TaxID=3154260 RepID=UPI00332031D1